MRNVLRELPEVVNLIFNVLDLIVIRLGLLGLIVIGLWALLHKH
jgi:hypothetical protein